MVAKIKVMLSEEMNEVVQISSEEVLIVLASIQGLLVLAEHYQNHPETNHCLAIIEKCTANLITSVKKAKINSGLRNVN